MSRSAEEIKEQYQDIIENVKTRYKDKHYDLDLAERIDIFLTILAERECLDIWFTVDMHYFDELNGKVVTKRIIGEEEE